MKSPSGLSLFSVVVAALCLSLLGWAFVPLLPLKLSPSNDLPSVSVSFSMRGATAKVVETEATSRIEAMLSRMSGVAKVSSRSGDGHGSVTVNFDKHSDMETARFEVSSVVRQIWQDLPSEVSYPSISVKSVDNDSHGPMLIYSVYADEDADEIRRNVDEVFSNGFADIGGVGDVSIAGGIDKAWEVTYDAKEAVRLGVSEDDVVEVLGLVNRRSNTNGYTISSDVADTSLALEEFNVCLTDSSSLGLDRFATLKHVDVSPSSIFRINGQNTISLRVYADESANQLMVGRLAEARIDALKRRLPQGYELRKQYDATERIRTELATIGYRSGLTVAILLVFVWLTSWSWRRALVVLCSIVCTLSISAAVFYALGVEMQLFSLAGVTIALNLIIDNTIVMADHWRRHHDLGAVLPIVAATLTTVAALSVVFFLDDKLRLSLEDFAKVMIVSLIVSIATSLTFVPALMELMGGGGPTSASVPPRLLRWQILTRQRYGRFISRSLRMRWAILLVGLLSFGLPLYMMPDRMTGDDWKSKAYNAVFGTKTYSAIRQYTDVIFGGALRLFAKGVYAGSYMTGQNETSLQVAASLPYGSTLEQMDARIRKLEAYLSGLKEVRQFHSQIGAQRATISIFFTSEAAESQYPYKLKNDLTAKVLEVGGGSWSIFGLEDQGFSNDVSESGGSYSIDMRGYNYEVLRDWADSMRAYLLSHRRIKEVDVKSRFSYFKDDYQEFRLVPDMAALAREGLSLGSLFSAVRSWLGSERQCGYVWHDGVRESIVLSCRGGGEGDVWGLLNHPVEIDGRTFKLGGLCSFEKTQAPATIEREDQQYMLCLQYEYIGSNIMGERVSTKADSIFSARVPAGFTVKYNNKSSFSWGSHEAGQYWLLGVILVMIFFICAVLFDSLRLPMVVIGMIPISYIGLFLTFYVFSLNFDQGGLAAMVLLCGITVNSSIYVVNEYRAVLRSGVGGVRGYLRALGAKLPAIMMTILSTVLGFLPFLIGSEKETFWFTLAAGTVGGLMFSLWALFFFLPPFCLKR